MKYIFTSEKLSVQVHPSDAQARDLEGISRGKEECWLVLDAEPGASLGVGFKQSISAEDMRESALSGTIEELMEWYPVQRGDFFYIPAGTVHAIGAGITLVEIQQNSDVTYRLYDYGRPRELHLDKGVGIAKGEVHPASLRRHLDFASNVTLTHGGTFLLNYIVQSAGQSGLVMNASHTKYLIVPLSQFVLHGPKPDWVGECVLVSANEQIDSSDGFRCLLIEQNKDRNI